MYEKYEFDLEVVQKMNIFGICTYETPCGWYTKWDKKCDKKIGCENLSREPRVNTNVYDEVIAPCVNCEKYKIDTHHCLVCWAHNFNSFKVKED